MPIWGLPSVNKVIAAGYDGPQHCDEPWNYQFEVGQTALIHLSGEGRSSLWVEARIVSPAMRKRRGNETLTFYAAVWVENGRQRQGDWSPEDGNIKPDSPYVRELILEELMWPIDEEDREVSGAQMKQYMIAQNSGRVPHPAQRQHAMRC